MDNPTQPPDAPEASGSPQRASLNRHARKCSICRHPDREAIEEAYLDWRTPEAIARAYGIADHSSVYRHIRATGLAYRRQSPVRHVLETILERAAEARLSGGDVVRAVWAYAHLDDSGHWLHHTTQNPNRQDSELNSPSNP